MDIAIIRWLSSILPALCGAALFLCMAVAPASAASGVTGDEGRVDVELILAVDVSWSMTTHEQRIERDGYVAAFRSQEVINAILDGTFGRVAVTYIEWSGAESQVIVVPWTIIDSAAASEAFAAKLDQTEPRTMHRTSISGALDFSRGLFGQGGLRGVRRVIDVSGDGPNNEGRPVESARDQTVAAGITINGLPLMTSEGPGSFGFSIADLSAYYSNCVIGGPQAFVIPVTSWKAFPDAVRRKLVLELAGNGTPVMKAVADPLSRPPLVQVQQGGGAAKKGFDCLVGEKMWGPAPWRQNGQ